MPNPHLSDAHFPTLKKDGTSNGTVTGSDVASGNPVTITTKNGKKEWQGSVGTQTADPSTWNASVTNTKWNPGETPDAPETVTVVVSNSSGPSNPVDTTSDIP